MTDPSIAAIRLPFIGQVGLVATLTQAIETGKPSIVFLEGIAGIGKTFLGMVQNPGKLD